MRAQRGDNQLGEAWNPKSSWKATVTGRTLQEAKEGKARSSGKVKNEGIDYANTRGGEL